MIVDRAVQQFYGTFKCIVSAKRESKGANMDNDVNFKQCHQAHPKTPAC